MDPIQVAKLMAELGISGIDPTKVVAAMELAKLLGGDIDIEPKEYLPDISDEESFYLPKIPKNFYYDPEVFRKLHSIDYAGLRSLVTPNLRRLRM